MTARQMIATLVAKLRSFCLLDLSNQNLTVLIFYSLIYNLTLTEYLVSSYIPQMTKPWFSFTYIDYCEETCSLSKVSQQVQKILMQKMGQPQHWWAFTKKQICSWNTTGFTTSPAKINEKSRYFIRLSLPPLIGFITHCCKYRQLHTN